MNASGLTNAVAAQPELTIRRVANGWIVEPYRPHHTCSFMTEVYVFRNWTEAQEYMLAATTAGATP